MWFKNVFSQYLGMCLHKFPEVHSPSRQVNALNIILGLGPSLQSHKKSFSLTKEAYMVSSKKGSKGFKFHFDIFDLTIFG